MFYLSQILKSKVRDSSDAVVGTLVDIAVEMNTEQYPGVVLLHIKHQGDDAFIPYQLVENFGQHEITLNTLFKPSFLSARPTENYIYLIRDILDKQIIDIEGHKVVRVNDLCLTALNERQHVVGFDISFRGILRRLGLSRLDLFNMTRTELLDWRNAQFVDSGELKLATASQKLHRLHPADLANIIEELNITQAMQLIGTLNHGKSAKVVEELEPDVQKVLFKLLGYQKVKDITGKMSSDELADLLQELPKNLSEKILANIEQSKLDKVNALIQYSENTAGGLMNNEFISLANHLTVTEAIAKIKTVSPDYRSIMFVYVFDQSGKLLGPLSLRNLLVAEPTELVQNLLKPIEQLTTLSPDTPLQEVVEIMTRYDLFTVAVLDDSGKLIGIVSVDDVLRSLFPQA